ncbi:uncharacterized protein A4U43_C08F16730 [Asparagus officinalis]|nr:uncharacterized protein A4U43_C08F16730 [Asparagus officinalis]
MPPLQITITLLLVISSLSGLATPRDLPPKKLQPPGSRSSTDLEEDAGLVNCWSAMLQLRSCSDEMVLFFVNGESRLGPDCCRAVRTITHQCWPTMLDSLGLTAEEGNVLRGFCDAEAARAPPPADAAAPVG